VPERVRRQWRLRQSLADWMIWERYSCRNLVATVEGRVRASIDSSALRGNAMMIGVGGTILILVIGWIAAGLCHVNDVDRDPLDGDLRLPPD